MIHTALVYSVLFTKEVKEVIETVAFAPDGKTLAAAGRGKMKMPAGDRLRAEDVEEEKDGPVCLLALKKGPVEKK